MLRQNRVKECQNLGRHIPQEDLILQNELQVCEENNQDSFLCPCTKCHGGHQYGIRTIQEHLRDNGRDQFLLRSMVGGDLEEGYPAEDIWIQEGSQNVPEPNVFDDVDMGTEYRDNLDPYHDIQQQLFDTFDLEDWLHEETPHVFEDAANEEEVQDDHTNDLEHLDELYRKGTRPLFRGTTMSTISAMNVLINMAVIHNVSSMYVDGLLKYLSMTLLPSKKNFQGVTMRKKLI